MDPINSPGDRRYLFIDGGYLRKRYNDAMQKYLGVDGSLYLEPLRRTFDAYRAFFYDCLDPRGTEKDIEAEEGRLAAINALPGYHVRPGKLKGKPKGNSPLRQKQVDIQLAVDMLEGASRNNFGRVELLAGDSDFVPLVDAVTRMGKWVNVIYDPSSRSDELLAAADSREQIGFENYKDWTLPGVLPELPKLGSNLIAEHQLMGYTRVAEGKLGSADVELAHRAGLYLIFTLLPPRQGIHKDPELLKRFFQAHHGEIQWRDA